MHEVTPILTAIANILYQFTVMSDIVLSALHSKSQKIIYYYHHVREEAQGVSVTKVTWLLDIKSLDIDKVSRIGYK